MKSKTTAAILSVFLGGIGIHQFYLNNNKKGLLYLIFCWTSVPAILALIDFIKLLTMSDNDFNNIYNNGIPPISNNRSIHVNNPQFNPQAIQYAQDDFFTYLKTNENILRKLIEQQKNGNKQLPSPQMQKLTATCSNCGRIYKNISPKYSGKTVNCKTCHEAITI
jgi:TM2 domain-containing membrane protein YozV